MLGNRRSVTPRRCDSAADNRTHHHLGFNLFVKGEADGREGRFIVTVSAVRASLTDHANQRTLTFPSGQPMTLVIKLE